MHHRLKRTFIAVRSAAREAGICFVLGLKDSLHPVILARSVWLSLLVTLICTGLFVYFFTDILKLCAYAALFTALSVANFALLPTLATTSSSVVFVPDPFALFNAFAGMVQLVLYLAAYTGIFFVILFCACVLLGVRLGAPRALLPSVRKRIGARYGMTLRTEELAVSVWSAANRSLPTWLGISGWTLACLLIPIYNGVLMLLGLLYLNIRFLLSAAIQGWSDDAEQLQVIHARKGTLLLFGLLMALLALIPVLNLLLPGVLCAGTCHLGCRALRQTSVQPSAATVAALPAVE
jgi:hypothetical protein